MNSVPGATHAMDTSSPSVSTGNRSTRNARRVVPEPLPPVVTCTMLLSGRSPEMMRRLSPVTTCFCTKRFNGRAPYAGSYPSSRMYASASSVMSILTLRSLSRWVSSSTCAANTLRRVLTLSGSKITTSSRRLRNSGRKWAFTTFRTRVCASSSAAAAGSWNLLSASPDTGLRRRLAAMLTSAASRRCFAPRLLVMMTTTLLKSTVRPWLSVRRPSSSTCSSTLNTSLWAFSTSSNRMTL
mmetsp:Transcript_65540/g.133100  ORF Transcript_65540/g.133100 Transcript_65540/m.133100 type:complete len:240 (+) Transcript_65540:118-837(+)